MRLKLTIAYDGRPFAGWQSQRNGRSVQDRIEQEISRIAGETCRIHGAGRTDAGVHALGQVAHVDLPERLSPSAWARALNARLPASIRILSCRGVPDRFHARFDARGKVYRYSIDTARVLLPLRAGTVWHQPGAFDETQLTVALSQFEGTHDFASFSANRGSNPESFVRTLQVARWARNGTRLQLTYEGDGFLYRMVRMLTAAALRVAQGKDSPGRIGELLDTPCIGSARHVAPAEGLTLVRVRY